MGLNEDQDGWTGFFQYLKKKIKNGLNNPTLVQYFVGVVFLFGLLGFWITCHDEISNEEINHRNMSLNLASYFIALIASGAADLILNNEKYVNSSVKMLGILSLSIGFTLLFGSLVTIPLVSYFFSFLGILVAWLIWVVANADTVKFKDTDFANEVRKNTKEHGGSWD